MQADFLNFTFFTWSKDNEYFLHHRRDRCCRCGCRLSRSTRLKIFRRNSQAGDQPTSCGRTISELRPNGSWGEDGIFAVEAVEGGVEPTRMMKAILSQPLNLFASITGIEIGRAPL